MITASQKGNFNIICLLTHDWIQIKEEQGLHFWKCKRCDRKEIIGSTDEIDFTEAINIIDFNF